MKRLKYRAIIFDLDGTLVRHGIGEKPHKEVIDSLVQASKFIKICISTSRPLEYAKPIINLLPINGLCAVNDGSQIYDQQNDTVLKTLYIDNLILPEIIRIYKIYTNNFMINTGDSEYEYKGDLLPQNICALCVPEIPEVITDKIINDLSSISQISIHKVLSHKPGLYWVVATNPLATKLHSVITISEYLHVNPKNIIGVGDGYTDYSLLSACGLKIAMGNAVSELKDIADYVAPSVDNDGVVDVLQKYVFH
jgi:hydroxymethylpyrimidine pyrophosphatase-like HAD family hydrolase